jgi:hypothetical protein
MRTLCPIDPADLIRDIVLHLERTGESEAAFGRRVANDPSLVRDLRQGRSPRLNLFNRIIEATAASRSKRRAA